METWTKDSWTKDDTTWLLQSPEVVNYENPDFIYGAFLDVIEDEHEPLEYYGRLIKTAPGLEFSSNREAVVGFLKNKDDVQGTMRKFVFERIKSAIPRILGVYRELFLNEDYQPTVSDDDIQSCVFFYAADVYRRSGIFNTVIAGIFEDESVLTEAYAREGVAKYMRFFLRYRRVIRN
jgi:hypothetical protein